MLFKVKWKVILFKNHNVIVEEITFYNWSSVIFVVGYSLVGLLLRLPITAVRAITSLPISIIRQELHQTGLYFFVQNNPITFCKG